MTTADIIKKYCEEAAIQQDDDLVFPQQDCMTLAMNLANLIGNRLAQPILENKV